MQKSVFLQQKTQENSWNPRTKFFMVLTWSFTEFYMEVCAFFNLNFKMFFYRRSAGPAVDMCGKSLYIDLNELQTYRRDQPQPQPKGNLLKAIDNKTAQVFYIANF